MNRKVIALAAAGLTAAGTFAGTAAATASTGATATAAPAAVARANNNYGVGNGISSSTGKINFSNRSVTVTGSVRAGSADRAYVSFFAYTTKNAKGKPMAKGSRSATQGQVKGFNFPLVKGVPGGAKSVMVCVSSFKNGEPTIVLGTKPCQTFNK